MTNDGHDTTISFTGKWARTFLEPLLNNSYFMNNTLVVLTFDEDESYAEKNKMFVSQISSCPGRDRSLTSISVKTVLLGGAIPTSLHNTTDSTFYNHYSMLSTVELNWGLPSLGRWDCNANVLALVANKTGYANQKVDTTNLYFNASYPGPLSDAKYIPVWPVPATNAKCAAGSILGSVVSTWGTTGGSRNYSNVYPYDAASNNNVVPSPSPSSTGTSSTTGTATGSSPSATTSKPSAANLNMEFSWVVLLGLIGIVSIIMV